MTRRPSTTDPLLVLAFDQRGWLSSTLWAMGTTEPVTGDRAQVMTDVKTLVADGLLAAKRPRNGTAGILVDTEFGTPALDRAHATDGITLCLPIEKNNREVLELEEDWRESLDRYQPEYAKLLIWHNPGGDTDQLKEQLDRLGKVYHELDERGQPSLLEILQPPTDEQLASVNGDKERFDQEIRPRLMVQAIEQCHGAGVFPHVWKLEGLHEEAAYREVLDAARAGVPHPTDAVVLGRNAPDAQVDAWVTDAARAGFAGFAIGRSIWWEAARRWLDGEHDRDAAVANIAQRYERFVDVYLEAV